MKCNKCGYDMDFHKDAWPVQIAQDVWTEQWVCPECGEEQIA